jgi:transposase
MSVLNITKIALAWELHLEGIPETHIAQRTGVNRVTIWRWLKEISQIGELALFLEKYQLAKRGARKKEISLKYILKQAYDDLLPETIRNRKDKIGFPSLVNEWLSHELAFLVEKSQQVLREAFPCERYFLSESKNLLYDRRKYQWVQLAATYLIYCERYNKETFNKFYRKEI